MPLALNDGYTIAAATDPTVTDKETGKVLYAGLPVVTYSYRPAMAVALADWRHAFRGAATGGAEVEASAKLLAAHLTAWDVTEADGRPAPITPANVARLPVPIAEQIFDRVTTWAGPRQEQAAGN